MGSGAANRTMKPLGIGMIGGGLMAQAHTMALRNLTAVYSDVLVEPRLVVLADATNELAQAGAERLGYERWTSSWEDVINDSDVDVVDIVTPNYLHKEAAIAAARAGKHIWCEKPLALNSVDSRDMVDAVSEAGVKTLVGFTQLSNPAVKLAKQLIDDGQIGTPVSFTGAFAIDAMADPRAPFSWRQDRARAGAGALGDVGAHVIAFAHYLVGSISAVSALSSIVVPQRPAAAGNLGYGQAAPAEAPMVDVENDDITLLLAKFENGAIGSIEASRVASGRAYDVNFTVTGTTGSIRFDQQHIYRLQVRLASDPADSHGYRTIEIAPGHGDYDRLWPVPGLNIGIHELKLFEARDLVRAIDEDSQTYANFEQAWRVQEVIDAADHAAQSGSWVSLAGV